MFLRNIVFAHKGRQHFVCVIEVKGQSLKGNPLASCEGLLSLPCPATPTDHSW
jgi:hypothetical protein